MNRHLLKINATVVTLRFTQAVIGALMVLHAYVEERCFRLIRKEEQ